MDSDELLSYLVKGKDDDELMLMCQAAVDELGPQGFLDAIRPAAGDALASYEEKLTGIETLYRTMMADIPDKVVRVGMLAGSLLDAPLEQLDLVTSLVLIIDWYVTAKDQLAALLDPSELHP